MQHSVTSWSGINHIYILGDCRDTLLRSHIHTLLALLVGGGPLFLVTKPFFRFFNFDEAQTFSPSEMFRAICSSKYRILGHCCT